mmetsp:Transcript_29826/g.92662  ORF Transcript_29826/g.92662 Transcript_29826/m.92662 type:complete len:330 (-) Transcript_29826:89-1078(-)
MFPGLIHANQMNYYPEVPQAYGAAGGMAAGLDDDKAALASNRRRRMNLLPLFIALFVPWALFCTVYATMSFSIHYKDAATAYLIVSLGFMVVVAMGLMAADSARRRLVGDPQGGPTWFVFLFVTCLIAWASGMLAGNANFLENMQPYFEVTSLNLYTGVDPASSRGQMHMDAGRIVFADDAVLDIKKSMGFRNTDTYCVAPISKRSSADGKPERLVSYDYWAVGVNCCSSTGPDFHCGQFSNPHARGGLRLMEDSQRDFFRLAVEEAQAAFHIKAEHPIFFHWMQDPVGTVDHFQDKGYMNFLNGVCSFLMMQTALVAAAMFLFSKTGN